MRLRHASAEVLLKLCKTEYDFSQNLRKVFAPLLEIFSRFTTFEFSYIFLGVVREKLYIFFTSQMYSTKRISGEKLMLLAAKISHLKIRNETDGCRSNLATLKWY